MKQTSDIKIGGKTQLAENLLIIEGITRSGKFLLGNLLNGLEDVEPYQYSTLLEQIPFLTAQNFIEKNTAKALISCEVDMRCYEMLIGRNINHRIWDKSSVYNIPSSKNFLKREKEENSHLAVQEYKNANAISPFILHEAMCNISIYFETFSKMKTISLKRDPIELAYSWYKRGLGRRWGGDPLLFQIPFSKEGALFPWFAYGWEDLYLKSSEADRVILSIKALVEKAQESYSKLPKQIKSQILIISFEDLVSNPKHEIGKISSFLGKNPLPQMTKILEKEDLPAKDKISKRKEKLKELKSVATGKYIDELLRLKS